MRVGGDHRRQPVLEQIKGGPVRLLPVAARGRLPYCSAMPSAPSTLRVTALIAAGALGLHQLRYLAGSGSESAQGLSDQGHAYLPVAGFVVAALLALASGQLLVVLGRARRTGGADRTRRSPLAATWLAATAALLAIYGAQELLEGLVAGGHAGGVATLVGDGGWTAFPLALALGGVVALALRGASAAVAAAARSRARGPLPRPRRSTRRRTERALPPAASVLGRHLAGRAPPLLS
jgi:hypothetical protein